MYKKFTAGFSILQLSVLVTAAGLLAAATLPSTRNEDINAKYLLTKKRMQKIEEATIKMMATWGRRPCPASGIYQPGNPAFGTEDEATPGNCTDGLNNVGIMDFGSNVVAGTVPVRKLHLPDAYAFDGWGRPFTYIVDKRATEKSSCVISTFQKGAISISGPGTTDHVMNALISHGQDGHGAFLHQGSSAANRFNSGSTNTDQNKNAGGLNFPNAPYANDFVKQPLTSGFDDYIWYSERYKNTCCLGKVCKDVVASGGGENILINGQTPGQGFGTLLASGQLNNDGQEDLVIGNALSNATEAKKVYVVFGKTLPLPNPYTPLFNGMDGYIITTDFNIRKLAVGNIDGDAYDDIVLTGSNRLAIIYGKSGVWSGNMVANQSVGVGHGAGGVMYGIYIYTDSTRGELGQALDLGDINADGKMDIAVSQYDLESADPVKAAGHITLLLGRDKGDYLSTVYDLSTLLDGTKGYRFAGDTSTANYTIGYNLIIADMNVAGTADLLMVRRHNPPLAPTASEIYVIFGDDRATWTANTNLSTIFSDNNKHMVLENTQGTIGQILAGPGYFNKILLNAPNGGAFEIQGYSGAHKTADDFELVNDADGNDSWGELGQGQNGMMWSPELTELKSALYHQLDGDAIPDTFTGYDQVSGGAAVFECLSTAGTCYGQGYGTAITGRYDAKFFADDSSSFGDSVTYTSTFTSSGGGQALAIADPGYNAGGNNNAGRVYVLFNWTVINNFTGGNLPNAAGGGSVIEPY